MRMTTLTPTIKPLTPSEELELTTLLRDKPVLARWFALIEQDINEEDKETGALLDMTPDQVKARQVYTAAKRDVVATLAQAIHIARSDKEE